MVDSTDLMDAFITALCHTIHLIFHCDCGVDNTSDIFGLTSDISRGVTDFDGINMFDFFFLRTFTYDQNSLLESLSLRKLHDIHFFTSATQSSIFDTAPSLSSAVHGMYSWVSSAYMCIPHLCFSAILNNGEVYRGKQNGPRTEPCGMPVFRSWGSELVPFIFTTCSRHVKYECSHAFTSD